MYKIAKNLINHNRCYLCELKTNILQCNSYVITMQK